MTNPPRPGGPPWPVRRRIAVIIAALVAIAYVVQPQDGGWSGVYSDFFKSGMRGPYGHFPPPLASEPPLRSMRLVGTAPDDPVVYGGVRLESGLQSSDVRAINIRTGETYWWYHQPDKFLEEPYGWKSTSTHSPRSPWPHRTSPSTPQTCGPKRHVTVREGSGSHRVRVVEDPVTPCGDALEGTAHRRRQHRGRLPRGATGAVRQGRGPADLLPTGDRAAAPAERRRLRQGAEPCREGSCRGVSGQWSTSSPVSPHPVGP
jgi:hypothetical protein